MSTGKWEETLILQHNWVSKLNDGRESSNSEIFEIKPVEFKFSIVVLFFQLLSHVQLFVTPWTAACQASPFFTISQSLAKLTPIVLTLPPNDLILCRSLLLPSIFPIGKIPISGSFPMSWFSISCSLKQPCEHFYQSRRWLPPELLKGRVQIVSQSSLSLLPSLLTFFPHSILYPSSLPSSLAYPFFPSSIPPKLSF